MSESSATQRDGARARVRLQGAPVESYPEPAPEVLRGRVREITEVGAEVLHRPCRWVGGEEFATPGLAALIDDMFASMYAAEGVGLAANQVGVDLRVFVYDCPDDDGVRHVGHVCNPVAAEREGDGEVLALEDEGCLSVPGPHAELARPEYALVRGFDRDGRPVEIAGSGYFARCLQHETDHTLGRLYIDRLAKRTRRKVLRRMEDMRAEVLERRRDNAERLAAGGAES
ncbi:peptide deformylase [Streptomonospora wellingtoniae]|uniref:Peptide deformylase n=1 Tax=Streptomonospora wellingtoniae TaxID=3075544 RepID=A0ABU2KTK6_9ACTN|nr:peptide deformylase [Streptomonospora sp. DSM 45055]MDT0302627.1 peptide deformylase [Streptomonospora sp. DSM 45055]